MKTKLKKPTNANTHQRSRKLLPAGEGWFTAWIEDFETTWSEAHHTYELTPKHKGKCEPPANGATGFTNNCVLCDKDEDNPIVSYDALPNGFDPLRDEELRQEIARCAGCDDLSTFTTYKVWGEVQELKDGTLVYYIAGASGVIDVPSAYIRGRCPNREVLVFSRPPSPPWSLTEKLIASYEWEKDGKVDE